MENKIRELEKKKSELISQVQQFSRRLRYKQYEQKALVPFVEQTKDIHIGQIKRMKSALEFKISTQAYTPRLEREMLKDVKKVDDQLKDVREVEWARRKIRFVEGDIAECEKNISTIEAQLRVIREELKKLYDESRAQRIAKSAVKMPDFRDEMVTLADIVIIEQGKKGSHFKIFKASSIIFS